MPKNAEYNAFLTFVRKVMEVGAGYSGRDFQVFHELSERKGYLALRPIIEEYDRLASETRSKVQRQPTRVRKQPPRPEQMHLFDLLRERRLFPLNTDLAEFAGRVLPNMPQRRFDKMSRGDIAARIIEYLEELSPRTRAKLEASMRQAWEGASDEKLPNKRSFFSTWERIIKGIDT